MEKQVTIKVLPKLVNSIESCRKYTDYDIIFMFPHTQCRSRKVLESLGNPSVLSVTLIGSL